MFCSGCGNPLGEGQRFCSKCGAPVDTGYQQIPPPRPPERPHVSAAGTAKQKKYGSGKLLIVIGILAFLLIAVIAALLLNISGVFSAKNSESVSDRDRDDDEDSSPEITDARSLARLIDAGYAEDSCITISGRGDMKGHAVNSDLGPDPTDFDMYLTYEQKVFPDGEADEETELHIETGSASKVTDNKRFSVSMENDDPVTYFLSQTDADWQKTDGDLLKPLRSHSDVFEQIAEGEIDAEYEEDNGDNTYHLSFTLTGDDLRSFLLQYANLFADNGGVPSSADWEDIRAEIDLEAHGTSDRYPASLEIELESEDLADALFEASGQFEKVSDAMLTLDISVRRYDDSDLEYELPGEAQRAENAEAVDRADIREMFETIIMTVPPAQEPAVPESVPGSEDGSTKYASIEELLDDPDEYDYYMEIARQLDNVDGRSFAVYADGDELVLHITYPDFGPGFMEDKFSAYIWDAMQDGVTPFSLEAMKIAEKVDIEKPYLRIIMVMPDGYELFNFAYAGGI